MLDTPVSQWTRHRRGPFSMARLRRSSWPQPAFPQQAHCPGIAKASPFPLVADTVAEVVGRCDLRKDRIRITVATNRSCVAVHRCESMLRARACKVLLQQCLPEAAIAPTDPAFQQMVGQILLAGERSSATHGHPKAPRGELTQYCSGVALAGSTGSA